MAAIPPVATAVSRVDARRIPRVRAWTGADYWLLTKPRVNFLIVLATAGGFYAGLPVHADAFPVMRLVHTVLGTLLVASGAATLNQYLERRFDAQMRRTARRPLAAGRLQPAAVLRFGVVLTLSGALYLAAAVNTLASLLGVVTVASYLAVYTPLKRKTPLCTLLGAFSGAMPPLIGCAAASGRLSAEAWTLYGVLFLWQFPHFMAIAWMYREDYDRAGYMVLPGGASRERFLTWQSALPAMALVPLSLMPTFLGDADRAYLVGALLLGSGFAWYAAQLAVRRSNANARRLLVASIFYLPALLLLLMAEKTPQAIEAWLGALGTTLPH
ncbi:MAG TPA: heme o synthase [Gemmatimonadales bacterium]|nr:heme o synthase [Gemmatimonadales bacterium]